MLLVSLNPMALVHSDDRPFRRPQQAVRRRRQRGLCRFPAVAASLPRTPSAVQDVLALWQAGQTGTAPCQSTHQKKEELRRKRSLSTGIETVIVILNASKSFDFVGQFLPLPLKKGPIPFYLLLSPPILAN
jgi:hypothetical protein